MLKNDQYPLSESLIFSNSQRELMYRNTIKRHNQISDFLPLQYTTQQRGSTSRYIQPPIFTCKRHRFSLRQIFLSLCETHKKRFPKSTLLSLNAGTFEKRNRYSEGVYRESLIQFFRMGETRKHETFHLVLGRFATTAYCRFIGATRTLEVK